MTGQTRHAVADLDPLLAAYVEWMADRSLSPKTVETRVSIIRLLLAHVGKPLAEMTAVDLQAWQRWLRQRKCLNTRKPMTAAARHTYVKQVRALFAWARTRELIPANPALVPTGNLGQQQTLEPCRTIGMSQAYRLKILAASSARGALSIDKGSSHGQRSHLPGTKAAQRNW